VLSQQNQDLTQSMPDPYPKIWGWAQDYWEAAVADIERWVWSDGQC